VEAFRQALPLMKKVREAYNDSLGDMINLDFAPKAAQKAAPTAPAATPAAPPRPVAQAATRPKISAADIAKAAAAKKR
jgi:hypothetical protein